MNIYSAYSPNSITKEFISGLSDYVTIAIPKLNSVNKEGYTRRCLSFSDDTDRWISDSLLSYTDSNDTHIICSSKHFSEFAVEDITLKAAAQTTTTTTSSSSGLTSN